MFQFFSPLEYKLSKTYSFTVHVCLCVYVHTCLHTRLLVCVNWPPPSTSKVYEMKVESLVLAT